MEVIDTKLQDMLNNEFTDDEQKIFLQHFQGFLNKDDEFIINIEFTFKWIGFTRKDNTKRLLEKHFIQNIDYICNNNIVFLSKEENYKNKEGRPNEIILMTPNTFKQLCILANTEKGKKVRLYYIKMENIVMKYLKEKNKINEELLKQFEKEKQEAIQNAKNIEYALQVEQEKIIRITNRRVQKEKKGHIVYIYKESKYKYKIGQSTDIAKRENTHGCSNTQNEIVYTKRCCNSKLLERVTHHILDQYRDINNREWFTLSFDIAKAALDSAHIFLDGLVDCCDLIYDKNFFYKLKDLVEDLSEKKDNIIINNNIIDESINEIEEQIINPIQINLDNIVNPLDFDKFINDYCEKDDNSTVYGIDIFGAHKQWSRCAKKTTHDAFYKYLCNTYKKVKIFDNKTNANITSYKGLKLKSIDYNKPNILEDIDNFINDKCEITYVSRVASKDIYKAFEIWKKNIDSEYILTPIEKSRIDKGFKNRFLPGLVYTGFMNNHLHSQSQHGYYFCSLKENKSFIGFKLVPSLKKKIIKIDINTKQIVETFESLTAAAISINRSPTTLSTDIIYKRPRDNYIYQYLKNE